MNNKKFDELFKILKIKPKNINLYLQALTHKTYSNENRKSSSYERLEFIGDSILQMYSSLYIYKTFKKESEGIMSMIRSNNVSSDALAKIIKNKKINQFIICSNNNELKNNEKICSDIFESLLAAIYIDLGEKEAWNFLERFLFKQIKYTKTNNDKLKDPKTKLQELLQPVHKSPIQYICNQNKNNWKCQVVCNKNIYGVGLGKTKKNAEINAAKNALNKLKT